MAKERFTVRLSEPVATAITGIAEEEGRTFAQVVDLLLSEHLGLRKVKVAALAEREVLGPEPAKAHRVIREPSPRSASPAVKTDFKGGKK